MRPLNSLASPGDVLALIASGAADTRAGLASATGMSRSTVADRLDTLFATGLIRESASGQSTGGRPSKVLAINHASHLVLAADIGEDHIRLALTDLSGAVLQESVTELAVSEGPEIALTWIAAEGAALVEAAGRHTDELLGVGLSVPAPVDFARGEVVGPSVMTGWDGLDIEAAFRTRLDIPVLVENDVNARALGEYLLGWRDHQNVLYVKAGTGIGSAILSSGVLFRGANGAAGDLGHIRIEPEAGPLCRCGGTGCVEALAAGWSMVRDLSQAGLEVRSTRDALARVVAGEPEAIHRLREAGRVLGRAIAYAVNILNPSLIIVGGSLTTAGDHLLLGVRQSVYEYSLSLATRDLELVRAVGDERCGAVGAAQLVIQRALEPVNVNERIAAQRTSDGASRSG